MELNPTRQLNQAKQCPIHRSVPAMSGVQFVKISPDRLRRNIPDSFLDFLLESRAIPDSILH